MNAGSLVVGRCAQHGVKTAVIDGNRSISHAELARKTSVVGRAFLDLGLATGDRVGLLFPNCLEWFELTFGIMRAGLVRVYLNPRLSCDEVSYLVRDSGCRTVVVSPDHVDLLDGVRNQLENVIVLGGAYEEVLARSTDTPLDVDLDQDSLCALQYSSGTTGRPKGVVLTHGIQMAKVATTLIEFGLTADDILLHAGPLMHMSGGLAYPALYRGATQIVHSRFDVNRVIADIEAHRITATALVPTMLYMLLDALEQRPGDMSSIDTILYGGSPISAERLGRCIDTFGNVLVGSYGLQEAPATTILPKEAHVPGSERLASAGIATFGTTVQVLDDDGCAVASRVPGQVVITGPQVSPGYWSENGVPATRVTPGIVTSDIGYLDDEGYLYLVDRKGEMIVSGGYNVYPREVEDVLMAHPAIAEAAVIAVPDDRWGETVKAVLSARPGQQVTSSDLDAWCRARMAAYKVPRSYDFEPGELPKNANGKIQRRTLRERYWPENGRRRIN